MDSEDSRETHHITELIEQVRAGDRSTREAALSALMREYRIRLLKIAGDHLSRRAKRRGHEPEAVVDSAFRAFFDNAGDFENRNSLRNFLCDVVAKKAWNLSRFEQQTLRDARRDMSPDDTACNQADQVCNSLRPIERVPAYRGTDVTDGQIGSTEPVPLEHLIDVLTQGATPEQAFYAIELFEKLSPHLQAVAAYKLQGYTEKNIADRLKIGERTVRRDLVTIRQKWCQWAGDDGIPFKKYLLTKKRGSNGASQVSEDER